MFESKTRPLWRFSDFVVEELPLLLVEDQAGITSKVQEILSSLEPELLREAFQENRELSLLDLKMAESAIIRTSDLTKPSRVPKVLTETVDWFCGNGMNIPGLQYHELVEVNPENDMRTFSSGEIRESEILFYNSHRTIERRLEWIYKNCEEFLSSPKLGQNFLAGHESMFDFRPIAQRMRDLMSKMPTDHFLAFRNYISTPCPVRNFDGPSGAYSWRIPYMEVLVWGNSLPPGYAKDISDKITYYSPEGMKKLGERIDVVDGVNCIADYSGEIAGVINATRTFIQFMRSFRKSHMGAVKKHLPDVANNKAPGTTGNPNAGFFLDNRILTMDELYAKYEQEYPCE